MPATLCISGYGFDVDEYLAKANWEGLTVHIRHKGDKRGHFGRLGVFEDSGFFIQVSESDFEDFEGQQKDAINFLETFSKNFELLSTYNIDALSCIDFGLEPHPASNRFSKSYTISPELAKLTGQYGLEIVMINYFTYGYTNFKKRARRRWWLRKERTPVRYEYRRKR